MRVAIIGAGAAAFALAVVLDRGGHTAVLWSPSGEGTRGLENGGAIQSSGVIEHDASPDIAFSAEGAVRDADVVILALPAMGHKLVMEQIAPNLTEHQVVVISAQLSFGALLLDRYLAKRGITLPIVAWNTTLLRSRKTSPTSVRIATLRKMVDFAVVPSRLAEQGRGVCEALFGERFNARSDLLSVALSNLNAQSHTALCLCNFTRMELEEEWDQADASTEGVSRLNVALDKERIALTDAFGCDVRSLAEHRAQTHGKSGPKVRTLGPATTNTRYTLEDAPYGLRPLIGMGRISGIDMSLHEAGLRLLSILYDWDLAAENDIIPEIGLESCSVVDLKALCLSGFSR